MFFKGSKTIKFIQDENMGDIKEDWDDEDEDSFLKTDESMKDLDFMDDGPIYSNFKPKERVIIGTRTGAQIESKLSKRILDKFKN